MFLAELENGVREQYSRHKMPAAVVDEWSRVAKRVVLSITECTLSSNHIISVLFKNNLKIQLRFDTNTRPID